MFEATDAANTAGDEGTYAMSLLMLSVSNNCTLRPSKEISPEASGTNFRRAKHKLVLPEPRAPTTARRLPACTAKLTLDKEATAGTRECEGALAESEGGGTCIAATLASVNTTDEMDEEKVWSSVEKRGCW
jgi:hypothetical protein